MNPGAGDAGTAAELWVENGLEYGEALAAALLVPGKCCPKADPDDVFSDPELVDVGAVVVAMGWNPFTIGVPAVPSAKGPGPNDEELSVDVPAVALSTSTFLTAEISEGVSCEKAFWATKRLSGSSWFSMTGSWSSRGSS
jgi:hypothetical protein